MRQGSRLAAHSLSSVALMAAISVYHQTLHSRQNISAGSFWNGTDGQRDEHRASGVRHGPLKAVSATMRVTASSAIARLSCGVTLASPFALSFAVHLGSSSVVYGTGGSDHEMHRCKSSIFLARVVELMASTMTANPNKDVHLSQSVVIRHESPSRRGPNLLAVHNIRPVWDGSSVVQGSPHGIHPGHHDDRNALHPH